MTFDVTGDYTRSSALCSWVSRGHSLRMVSIQVSRSTLLLPGTYQRIKVQWPTYFNQSLTKKSVLSGVQHWAAINRPVLKRFLSD